MMYRKSFEDALTDIDDRFIEEAIGYKKESKITSLTDGNMSAAKIAATTLITLGILSVTVYASVLVFRNAFVQDHSISVGNQDYVIDSAIATITDDIESTIPTASTEHFDGGADVNWTSKNIEKYDSGIINTYYYYDSIGKALLDYEFDSWVYSLPDDAESVSVWEMVWDDYKSTDISAEFSYGSGTFRITDSFSEGNVADDAAYVVALSNTSNERVYRSSGGIDFTLVDEVSDVTQTYVMLSRDKYNGYISFKGLSEDEIHQVLDMIK